MLFTFAHQMRIFFCALQQSLTLPATSISHLCLCQLPFLFTHPCHIPLNPSLSALACCLTFTLALIFPNSFLANVLLTIFTQFLPHFCLLLEELVFFQDYCVCRLWKEGGSFVLLLRTKLLHIMLKARVPVSSSSLILLHVRAVAL